MHICLETFVFGLKKVPNTFPGLFLNPQFDFCVDFWVLGVLRAWGLGG